MKASIKYENGMPLVVINGKEIPFAAYRSWRPKADNYRGFAEAGFPFITILPTGIKNRFGIPYSEFGEYWIGDGKYDWDVLRRQMDLCIENAPDSYIAVNIMLDTRDWFLKEHPDCLNSFVYFTSVTGYKPWMDCAERMIRDTIDFFEREYPEKVFILFLAAGGTCEWHNKAFDLPESAVRDRIYRERMGDDAVIPSVNELNSATYGNFRTMADMKKELEYIHYINKSVNESIEYFAHVVKDHTNGNLLVGAAAGYALGGGGVPLSGHSYTADVVRMKDVDVIVCPASYFHRSLDGVSGSQTTMDSVRLNGKLMVTSIDNKSYASRISPMAQILPHAEHESMEQSISYVRRESALSFSKGAGFWIFDMYGVSYPDRDSREALGKVRLAPMEIGKKNIDYNAQIAFLSDPRSLIYTNAGMTMVNEFVQQQITELGRIGAPVDYYPVDDILLDSFPKDQYKLYILPTCFAPSDEIRKAVAELKKNGASFIFMNAAGCITEDGFSYESGAEFTGIRIKEDENKDFFAVIDQNYTGLGYDKVYAGTANGALQPVMTAEEDECEVMARDMLLGTPKMVLKERSTGFDVWSFRGAIPECTMRELAKKAGVFIYQEESLPTYANSRMAAFFDHKGRKRKLRFPNKCSMTEYYSGEKYEYDGGELEIDFKENELKLFIIE